MSFVLEDLDALSFAQRESLGEDHRQGFSLFFVLIDLNKNRPESWIKINEDDDEQNKEIKDPESQRA